MDLATTLALAALGLSSLSFWVTWVRRGRLLCNGPAATAWIRMPKAGAQVAIPLVFYNTGARSLVVEAVQLRVQPPQDRVLVWNFTRPTLSFEALGERDFPRPFAVGGRESLDRVFQFVEFDRSSGTFKPGEAELAVVFVRFADRKYLVPVTTVILRMPEEPVGDQSLVSVSSDDALEPLRAPWRSRRQRASLHVRFWWSQRKHARQLGKRAPRLRDYSQPTPS